VPEKRRDKGKKEAREKDEHRDTEDTEIHRGKILRYGKKQNH
jgi:hypothetical protein